MQKDNKNPIKADTKIIDTSIKKIKRPFVNNSCIWCGACVAICPKVFEFTDEWYSKAKKLDSYEWLWVDDAISACPVWAIVYVD